MEPTSGQRKVIFVLVVAALAGLGWYLLSPAALGAGSARAAAASPRPAASRGPAASARRARPAATPAASAAGPAPSSAPDIYRWLPFTPAELGAAAAVVQEFGRDYATFSYGQDAAGYVAGMRGLITPELSQLLARGYSVPGVASLRDSQKQVATGSAVISSLRAFGPSSLTFVVTITEQVTGTGGHSGVTGQYAVTVTGGGSSWQVSDIELASAGDS
jgi:hypothetical protein